MTLRYSKLTNKGSQRETANDPEEDCQWGLQGTQGKYWSLWTLSTAINAEIWKYNETWWFGWEYF